jgi:hypothetical protein
VETESSATEGVLEGRDRATGALKWTGTVVDLVFGSQLAAARPGRGVRRGRRQPEVCADFVAAWVKVMNLDRFDPAQRNISKDTALDEKGNIVKGRGDTPNEHDILTGSRADGTAFSPTTDTTCKGWTSSTDGSAIVGHHDRAGPLPDNWAKSWNFSHQSAGCSQEALVRTRRLGPAVLLCRELTLPHQPPADPLLF